MLTKMLSTYLTVKGKRRDNKEPMKPCPLSRKLVIFGEKQNLQI